MLAALVLAMAACCPPGSSEVPDGVKNAVQILNAGHIGWGAPYGSTMIVTAHHLMKVGETPQWRTPSSGWQPGEIVCDDEQNDIAILRSAQQIPFGMHMAKKRPQIQDRLWWRAYIRGTFATIVRGYYLGESNEHEMVIDGWGHPGASGSPIVNDDGEMVGMVQASANDAGNNQPNFFFSLDWRASFRAFLIGSPLDVGPCKLR